MARHRRPHGADRFGRVYDNDQVAAPGTVRWADLVPTCELPLINTSPAELVRPLFVAQERRRWRWWWTR
jgi:hypothetical protein